MQVILKKWKILLCCAVLAEINTTEAPPPHPKAEKISIAAAAPTKKMETAPKKIGHSLHN